MFITHALLADTSESYSLSPLLNNYVRAARSYIYPVVNAPHRTFTLYFYQTPTDMSTHGRRTDYGKSRHGRQAFARYIIMNRYKNRQIVGFNEKCMGIDLNRSVLLSYLRAAPLMLSIGIGYARHFYVPRRYSHSLGPQMEANCPFPGRVHSRV